MNRRTVAAHRPHATVPVVLREAAQFDRRLVSFSAGLLAAIPVVVVLGGALALHQPVAAATMAAGAMLVGTAWRTGGGRPPLALMATDAIVMATSTFVGCVTGADAWIYLAALCLWSLMAGLLVSLGRRGAVIGTQSIIAAVVFGRFSEPGGQALGLAALVLAGGLTQVLFLSIVRWPSPLRARREATAAAYRALAALAVASPEESALPAAGALDEAEAAVSSATLFAEPALITLRSLVTEGHRLRVQLSALRFLLDRDEAAGEHLDQEYRESVERALAQAAAGLGQAARTLAGERPAAEELGRRAAALSAEAEALAQRSAADTGELMASPDRARRVQITHRLSSLAGQLRAVASLAPAAGQARGLRARRPYGRAWRPLAGLRADLDQIRANATLQSPAGRHALRLAVVVPVAEVISRQLPLQRGYWMVVAAATVLRPEFGATFTRATERALGTCLGVGLAGAIAVVLHPAGAATVALVGALAWAGYALFPASFAVGFGFITALVVFLLNAISPDTLATASTRLLDTLVGSVIGLLAYAVWPTWSRTSARQALASLVGAERGYIGAALRAATEGRRAREQQMRPLGRRVRLARTTAEETIARSLSEPETRRIDAMHSQAVLGVMRRLSLATHVLRLEAEEDREREPLPALARLAADVDRLLASVEVTLAGRPEKAPVADDWPDLRAEFLAFEHACPKDSEAALLVRELDEIVDAANGLAAVTGLER
ncbi:MAG: FUSC family protein [Solirubrobacterales bacterium]|nr:FUSC family protein [Solirubrobacterales bacterium]